MLPTKCGSTNREGHDGGGNLAVLKDRHRSRFAARQLAVLILRQSRHGPERYGEAFRLLTTPSSCLRSASAKSPRPSSKAATKRRQGTSDLANSRSSRRRRSVSGSCRRSAPVTMQEIKREHRELVVLARAKSQLKACKIRRADSGAETELPVDH
jgi:hypothetical protein